MTEHYHAIVWIDHSQAQIFHFNATAADKVVVPSHATGHHLHHKANTHGSGHLGVDKEFFKRVAADLAHAQAVLLTGPANAKTEFKHYIAELRPEVDSKIAGVETLDHPSDNALVALARNFFKVDDRMTG